MNNPILITGCPRSGTSMIAGILHKLGVFAGDIDRRSYENVSIREGLSKMQLRRAAMDVNGCFPIRDKYPIPFPEEWNDMVQSAFIKQGRHDDELYFYKDSRIALLWKIWLAAYPNAKWIIVKRRVDAIVDSCEHTGFMKTFDDYKTRVAADVETSREGWENMVEYYNRILSTIGQQTKNVKWIWPEVLVQGETEPIREICDWIGIRYDEKTVRDFIEPKIFRRS